MPRVGARCVGDAAHGHPLADIAWPAMDLSGTWRARHRRRRAAPHGRRSRRPTTTPLGARSTSPATGARTPAFADERRAAALPHAASSSTRRRRASAAAGWCSTASSTRATCGSTAPTSATPRATSSRTPSTITDASPRRHEHVLAVEVACARRRAIAPAKRNITGVFQHWDCIDPTGTRAASGDRSGIERTGPVRIDRLRVLCREADASRADPRRSSPTSTATRPARCALRTSVDGGRRVERRAVARRRASTRSSGRFGVDNPAPLVAVGARRRSRCTTSTSTVLGRRRGERRARTCAPGCGRWRCATGSCRSTASGCSSRAPTSAPTRMALGEATPSELRARRRRSRATPASTCSASTATSPRPELYDAADELGHAPVAGLPAAVGLRPQRPQAGGPPGARGGRPARPPPVDRALVRAQRAARASTSSTSATARSEAFAPKFVVGQQLPTWNQHVLDRCGEAGLRAGRRHPAGRSPTRGVLPHLPAARRHRQPPLLRLVPRRRARPAGASPRGAPHGPLRQRVRRAGRARRRRVHASRSAGPTSTGSDCRAHHALQKTIVRQARAARPTTPRSTRGGTRRRRYQATVLRHHIETLRRLKYRPTGGFAQFLLRRRASRR